MTKGFPPREIKVIWKSLSLSLIVKDLFSESDNSETEFDSYKENPFTNFCFRRHASSYPALQGSLEIRPKLNKCVHAVGVRQTISGNCTCCLAF